MISVTMVAIVGAGCAAGSSSSPPPSPSAVASPAVICDTAQFQPPSLTCGPAIAAALAVLAPGPLPIIWEEFRWGGLCPPGAPCAPPLGDAGIVIFGFAGGPSVFVYVSAEAGDGVTASSPAPYPSGY